MELVAAKCPQCGANIKVDKEKDAGICEFCGTAFITEKAINNYNTYVTNNNDFSGANINVNNGDINNLLDIAKNALIAGNGQEAYNYANRALELNTNCSEAWITKMKSLEYVGTVGDPRSAETITCGKNAIEFSEEKQKTEEEVYVFYLKKAKNLLTVAVREVNDVEDLKKAYQAFCVADAFSASKDTQQADMNNINMYENLANEALLLKVSVPQEKIEENVEYQKIVEDIANLYVNYSKGLTARYAIYGVKLLDTAVSARRQTLEFLKKGLKQEEQNNISGDEITNQANNGCYIATCIYGSYDCPEVWILRRFRDYTLDSTWYGKMFIKGYYAVSPTLVKYFGNQKWFRSFWKRYLDKMVIKLKEKGVKDSFYADK